MCDFTDAEQEGISDPLRARSPETTRGARFWLVLPSGRPSVTWAMCEGADVALRQSERCTSNWIEKHEYARIEAIGIEHTLEMRNPPWAQGGSR